MNELKDTDKQVDGDVNVNVAEDDCTVVVATPLDCQIKLAFNWIVKCCLGVVLSCCWQDMFRTFRKLKNVVVLYLLALW